MSTTAERPDTLMRLSPFAAGHPLIDSRAYADGQLVASGFAVEELPSYLTGENAVVWIGLDADTAGPLLQELAEQLGFDQLSVEDAISRHERPKVDHYPGYVFLNAYLTQLESGSDRLILSQVSALVAPKIIITVHAAPFLALKDLERRWDDRAPLVRHGSVALLYGLLDQVVDNHFDTVQTLDDAIDEIEDLLFDERAQAEVQARTFRLRKSLAELRRVVLPMRDVVSTLLRRDVAIETGEMLVYLDDVHDHVLRVIEWTESLRDMVTAVFETNLTLQDHRLNIVIKKLTSWAAIIAVPTLVTGFFGQNVEFPGEGAWSGLGLSAAVIAVTSTVLYRVFKRRDWI